jgi:arylsulfatase A-like enzyme
VRVARPVSLVDVAPTLLALFGAPAPEALAGRDLAPLWRERDPAWPERSLYAEADRTVERRDTQRAVMRGRWKLVVHREGKSRELSDVEADPQEQKNLAEAEPARTSELEGDLGAALAAARTAPALPEPDAAAREQLRALGYLQE